MAELDQKDFLLIEKDGRRTGPHSVDTLRQKLVDGEIDANCKVHVKRLFGWKMISEVFDLSSWGVEKSPRPEPETETPVVAEEPVAEGIEEEAEALQDTVEENLEEAAPRAEQNTRSENKSGLGRSAYCSWAIGGIVFMFVLFDTSLPSSIPFFREMLIGIYIVALVPLTAQRLVNIGENPNWCLTIFVPLMNLLTIGKCLSCPEGYAENNSLDLGGRIIFGIFILLVAVFSIGWMMMKFWPRFF